MKINNNLPQNYREQVYAGWVGKCAGVRFGAPVENWTYKDIKNNLGELTSYLPLAPGKIFKPDDDTAFPMILVKAIQDHGPDLSPDDFADTMLNYLADQRGTLWWGGYGISTEHTAYLNLAGGIPASLSGSTKLNGLALAEQIGGQIFSDIWGMILPNNPTGAADYSEKASSISHDGNGLFGARFIAALASLAFNFDSPRQLITNALKEVPSDSAYAQVVNAMLEFHLDTSKTWHDAYEYLFNNYGYDRYPGVVPIIPNAGVIVLALLYGNGDFSQTISIGNMCGWDTDCNVGNLGAIMGIAKGIEGIPMTWRDSMQDELVLASVVGADNYLDIPECSERIADCGEIVANGKNTRPANRYGFLYPQSTQGFRIGGEAGKIIRLWNPSKEEADSNNQGHRGLCAVIKKLGKKSYASWYVKTSCRVDELTANYYGASFSPKLYPGQNLSALLYLPLGECGTFIASIYVKDSNSNTTYSKPGEKLIPGLSKQLEYTIPYMENAHISEAGIIIHNMGDSLKDGRVIMENFNWNGAADYRNDFSLERAEAGAISQWTFLRGYWRLEDDTYVGSGPSESETYTGSPEWCDYTVQASITAHLGDMHGLMARVQGARRSYIMALTQENTVALFKKNGEHLTELSSVHFSWKHGETHELSLTVTGNSILGKVDGRLLIQVSDKIDPYLSGQIGLMHGKGCRTACDWFRLTP